MTEARPAFYALAPGGWRDYVTLLHPPYTAWHLSYVAIGACLAPKLYEGRLAAALVAFFLALGISAHALDELNGRPLQTQIPEGVLVGLTLVPLAGAVAIRSTHLLGLIRPALTPWKIRVTRSSTDGRPLGILAKFPLPMSFWPW